VVKKQKVQGKYKGNFIRLNMPNGSLKRYIGIENDFILLLQKLSDLCNCDQCDLKTIIFWNLLESIYTSSVIETLHILEFITQIVKTKHNNVQNTFTLFAGIKILLIV
jgi:hypothetical protein